MAYSSIDTKDSSAPDQVLQGLTIPIHYIFPISCFPPSAGVQGHVCAQLARNVFQVIPGVLIITSPPEDVD